ncbi:phospholipase D-like domain-containing protein [Natrinema sp. HArc-T2]|uniref:phospholipase D-like domain-containing protein n=1 Tax=Natrinema sp. HArc-T2 TaxID=3242701 RepID=UPI00359DEEAB
MTNPASFPWIIAELSQSGTVSIEDLHNEFDDEYDLTYGEEYLKTLKREGIIERLPTADGRYQVTSEDAFAAEREKFDEASEYDTQDFDRALVISVPSPLLAQFSEDDFDYPIPMLQLDQALQRVLIDTEDVIRLGVPYLEGDGLDRFADELYALAEQGVSLRVLTRELLVDNPADRDLKAARDLLDKYEDRIDNGGTIEIRDFYHAMPSGRRLDMSVHFKMAIADQTSAYVGSGEFRRSSMYKNGEAGYLVRSTDEARFWAQFFDFFWEQADQVTRTRLES